MQLVDCDRWNPTDFAPPIYRSEPNGQLIIFPAASLEPPDPDDYATLEEYEAAWQEYEKCVSVI